MAVTITSMQNPMIRDIQRLLEKNRERKKSGLFVAEGRREVSLALSKGYDVHTLLLCPDIFNPDPFYPVDSGEIHGQTCNVSAAVYNKLAYRNDAEGIIMVARTPSHSLEKLTPGINPLILILENVEKPGNLGAMLRTCDAAGIDAVIICDPATDIYNPNVIRSSLGCVFTQNIGNASVPEVVQWLKENNITTFAATPEASEEYSRADLSGPSALVFGSESQGLSEELLNATSRQISIPMSGKIDSLNVSVSAAIIIFEAVRQRRRNL